MRTLHMLVAVACLAASASADAADKLVMAPPEAWVRPIPLPHVPEKNDGTAVRILLNDQQFAFGAEGDSLYVESAALIQTAQGLAPMGSFAVKWKPDTDTLTVHKFQVIRDGKTIDLLAKGPGFTILRREDNLEYAALDGALTATIQPEGLQIGDIVNVAYTVRRSDPILQGHSGEIVRSVLQVPVDSVHISAIWPTAKKVQLKAIAPPASPVVDLANGRFSLSAANVGRLIGPKGAPPRYWTEGQVEFSDYASWAEVAATFAPLYDIARRLKPGSPLSKEIAHIRASASSPIARAEAALALVQDKLRYVFLGMNDGHLRPADADTSWERRFGDCKAKTALLLSLLDGLGITAEPALVSVGNGDGLDQRLPSAGLFDHVIVKATIEGRVYWLDGTRSGDTSLARLRTPPFRWALPLRKIDAKLERLIVEPLSQPDLVTEIQIDATAGITKPAKARVEIVVAGDAAVMTRFQLANLKPADLDRALREYWKAQFDFITPDVVSARFDSASGTEHILIEGVAKLDWNLEDPPSYYEIDRSRLGWRPDFDRQAGLNRDAPFAIDFPSYVVSRETVLLPDGGKDFSLEGKDVDQKLAGYHFQRKTSRAGNMVRMESISRAEAPEISFEQATASTDALRELSKRAMYIRAPRQPAAAPSPVVTATLVRSPARPALSEAMTHQMAAERFAALGNSEQAIAEAKEATRLDPSIVTAYQLRARLLVDRHKPDEAGREADALMKAKPADAHALAVAGMILCDAGRSPDASRAFASSVASSPTEEAFLARARCRAAEDVIGRRDDLEAALKLDGRSIGGLTMLARLQRELGQHDGEIDSLSKLAALDDSSVSRKVQLGGAYARAGRTERARASFAAARAEAAQRAFVWNALCWEAGTAGLDLTTAEADCRKAVSLNPEDAAIWDSLGMVLLKQRRFREAIDAYDRAVKDAPQQATALYGRGLARRAIGSDDAAKLDIEQARSLKPGIAATFTLYGFPDR